MLKFAIMHLNALRAKFYDELILSITIAPKSVTITQRRKYLTAEAIPERLSGHALP